MKDPLNREPVVFLPEDAALANYSPFTPHVRKCLHTPKNYARLAAKTFLSTALRLCRKKTITTLSRFANITGNSVCVTDKLSERFYIYIIQSITALHGIGFRLSVFCLRIDRKPLGM